MTRVKLYSTETGTVETIKTFDYNAVTMSRFIAEQSDAAAFANVLVAQDHSTDHVYYLDQS